MYRLISQVFLKSLNNREKSFLCQNVGLCIVYWYWSSICCFSIISGCILSYSAALQAGQATHHKGWIFYKNARMMQKNRCWTYFLSNIIKRSSNTLFICKILILRQALADWWDWWLPLAESKVSQKEDGLTIKFKRLKHYLRVLL